jgi:2-polyprenyl-3-methyl-5-hydroxy-6-metoxy-1,4-benzoquinol methylase
MRQEPITPASLSRIAKEIYTEGPWATRLLQHWRPYICPFDLAIEHVPAGSFVLDVGCGGGLLLGALARIGRIRGGVGFDFSADGIRVAKAMLRAIPAGCDLQFHHLSAMDRWPEGPFTVVSLIDVMHHVPVAAQRDVFRTAARPASGASVGALSFLEYDYRLGPRRRAGAASILYGQSPMVRPSLCRVRAA